MVRATIWPFVAVNFQLRMTKCATRLWGFFPAFENTALERVASHGCETGVQTGYQQRLQKEMSDGSLVSTRRVKHQLVSKRCGKVNGALALALRDSGSGRRFGLPGGLSVFCSLIKAVARR